MSVTNDALQEMPLLLRACLVPFVLPGQHVSYMSVTNAALQEMPLLLSSSRAMRMTKRVVIRVSELGFRVAGLGFRISGLGFGVSGLGLEFRV